MSVVRTFFPEVRLKRLMSEPGGIRASEALRRAEAGLESIRDVCLAALDLKIEALAALPDQLDSLEAAYRLANEIFAEAGTFDLNELSAAAYNLCQALAPRMPAGPFPPEVVRVHVQSMRALRTPGAATNQALRSAILMELQKLAQKAAC